MKVSVVIRSKNEERFIGAVLERVLEQEFSDPYEVLVLDSGSQDRTLAIVRGFPVRLVTMPPEQFTFGRALNHGASLTAGDYVVFLSAHCVPRERTWLQALTAPLARDVRVAATHGRQEPMPGGNPFEAIELARAYTLRPDHTVRAPLSNANSAVRRSVWQHHSFDEQVTFGEHLLCARTLSALYTIQYVHEASVFHSHPLVFRYWRKRWYEEGRMGPYLTHVHAVADPWATVPPVRTLVPKWQAFRRMRDDVGNLWRQREIGALCWYPVYLMNRIYFFKKGQREREQEYRRVPRL